MRSFDVRLRLLLWLFAASGAPSLLAQVGTSNPAVMPGDSSNLAQLDLARRLLEESQAATVALRAMEATIPGQRTAKPGHSRGLLDYVYPTGQDRHLGVDQASRTDLCR